MNLCKEELEFIEDMIHGCISTGKEILKSEEFSDERTEVKKEIKYAKKLLRKIHKLIDTCEEE